ncbi:hypothetical protein IFU30_10965 [Plantibacter sp. CFBP 8798]|uniref:pyocin knob domain-containing protein n=1 Tax=Plantibacter sp. CFBP 8798 TaxID=2775268 RepID=UPI001785414E|nr:pyocin knob domain-containing protein [Plantibacter sp. CFBP 8798]MBD8466788.1 hypothetical protein [Plantibacter sp. CFBP 8798]
MTNLIGTIDDFGPQGLESKTGAVLILRLDQFDPYGVSTKEWRVPLIGGAFTTILPTLHDGSIYLRADGVTGFPKGIHFANYAGEGNVTLTQLLTDRNSDGTARYLVDPSTLEPLQAPQASVAQILARALRAAQDAEAAEESADRAGTSAFNAGSSATSALGHANEALDAEAAAKTYRDEAIGVADSSVINATKTVSGDQYLVKLNRKNGPDIDLGDLRGKEGLPGLNGAGVPWGTNLSTSDLDTVTTPGVYRQPTAASATLARNYPVAGNQGVLEVFEVSSVSGVVQRFTSQGGATGIMRGFHQRRRNSATWEAWRFIATQRVDNTAGRAIYTWDDLNGREQLIYGDTGYRNIKDSITLDAVLTTLGIAYLSRQGAYVELQLSGLNKTAGSTTFTGVIPAGFRPSTANASAVGHDSGGNLPSVTVTNAGALIVRSSTPVNNGGVTISFRTNDAWPTTLPGSAAGSIPNL